MRHSFALAADPTSARAARQAVAELAALLVSELVTNVVSHTPAGGTVVVDIDDDRLRVEVLDSSDTLPQATRMPDPLADGGRGLLLVGSLSDRHGMERLPDRGKVSWFELDRRHGAAPG